MLTGIGVVAPTGIGVDEHWRSSLDRTCRIRPIRTPDCDGLPIKVAGEVLDFVESEWVPSRLRVQTDRWTHFALAGTKLALVDAELRPQNYPRRWISVITASASGGNEFGQREIQALWSGHPSKVSAYQSIGWFYAASTGQISIEHGLTGGCGVVVSDGAGGLDASKQAQRVIRSGSKAVLVGVRKHPRSRRPSGRNAARHQGARPLAADGMAGCTCTRRPPVRVGDGLEGEPGRVRR